MFYVHNLHSLCACHDVLCCWGTFMPTSRSYAICITLSCEIDINIPTKKTEMFPKGTKKQTIKLTCTTFIISCDNKTCV